MAVSGPDGGPYTVTFGGTLGGDNISTLESSGAGLSGGAKTATVSTLVTGGSFEVCVQAAGDVCMAGDPGTTLGHFRGTIPGLAEDASGAIYVVDGPSGNATGSNHWVQKLTPSGSTFVPTLFGTDEVQKLTVNAGSGQFRLSFGTEPVTTTGTGNLTAGSTVVTNVSTNTGHFAVGESIHEGPGGNTFYIPLNTVITAVGANTITMSKPARSTTKESPLFSNTPYVTPDLQFDSAPSAVEAALNALPSVGAAGGSVTVSGGAGDPAAKLALHDRVFGRQFPQRRRSPDKDGKRRQSIGRWQRSRSGSGDCRHRRRWGPPRNRRAEHTR